MLKTLMERVRTWLHSTFPERQIYIRSDGRVQFFTFGTPLQASLTAITLLFLGWVAFASVNVLFRDRIVIVKDHRYQQMQANYENRLADLQMSYDELNGAVVSAEDKFRSVADQLELKQQAIGTLFGHSNHESVTAALTSSSSPSAAGSAGAPVAPSTTTSAPLSQPRPDGTSELSVMPQPVEPQPRSAGPVQASILGGATQGLFKAAAALVHLRSRAASAPHSAPLQNSTLAALADQTSRLERISYSEAGLVREFDADIGVREARINGVMRRVGLNPDRLKSRAVGGPLLPLSAARLPDINDPEFTNVFAAASAHRKELQELASAFSKVPLTTPVHGSGFELTSDFGPRIDPFTHRAGFHPGLDFAGPWGAAVSATAPGTVVYAGPRGGYGNMIEIDHGFGIRTRYGHLSSILVRPGTRVQKGTPVGRLGSTGRSTGPHVHYEVWLADAVRDPSRFIEAGRHVQ